MKLDQCIQRAIDAGEVDRDLGARAQEHYRALVQRYVDGGNPLPVAEMQAADEAIESITRGAKARRHASLRMLDTMAGNEARYADAWRDPDLIVKDVERVQSERHAIERGFMAAIADALVEFRTNPLGMVRNRAMLKEVLRELHGEASGNAAAKAMADAIRATQERARAMFNALGGDIGKLDDWGVRHTHHAAKIARDGFDRWFAYLYDGRRIAWHRIVNHDTGKPFAVAAGARPPRDVAQAFLRDVFDTITTGGWVDRSPSTVLAGRSVANRRAEHRVLHFAGADAWMDYNELYGTQNPFDAIVGHFRGMARDIALMRSFGPNPNAGLTHALQVIEKGARLNGDQKLIDRNASKAKTARVMMRILTGQANVPHSGFWASFMAGTRNLLTAAQLGSAPLSSVTDWVSMRIAAKAVGLNPNSATQAMISNIANGLTARQARDMGFIFDTWFDTTATEARFMGSIWAPEITSRITSGALRLNGMAFLTDRARVAVQAAFGSDLAELAGKGWDDLPGDLRNFMSSRRITAADWDALRDPRAIFTDAGGGRHVNAEWFRVHSPLPEAAREDIAIRWGAMVQDHMELAIPSASLRGRAAILGDSAPGSVGGELLRSGLMYKSFVLSQFFGQLRRIQEIDGGPWSRALYVAKYMALFTLAGALAVQLKEVAKGRDPRPMDDWKFWAAALLQGGGVGIFGDFFSSTTSRAGGGLAETLGGPVVGLAGDIGRAVNSNLARAAEGKPVLIGRDVVNLARRYNPLATFQPPIPVPTRVAMDRLVWDQLQLALDPEALDQWRQAERKLKRDYGTQSWWRRGQPLPDRPPAPSNIVGDR